MRPRSFQHLLMVSALGVALLPACSGAPDPSSGPASEERTATTSSALTVTRSDAIARGEQWVVAMVPYCQAANHQPDADTACSPTCTRPDNVLWDPYRSDCSGFLSWAWGLPAPGRTTFELAPAVTDITHTIDPMTLMPGDAVNKPHDHTMLFVAWITPGRRATFMEEPGCSSATPYAHQLDSNVTISGTSITVAANGITFSAIRYDAIVDDDAGAPAQDASTSHDSGTTSPDGSTGTHDSGSVGASDASAGTHDSGAGASPDASTGSGDTPPPGNGSGNDGWGATTGSTSGCAMAPTRGDDARTAMLVLFGIAITACARGAARRRRWRSAGA